MSSIVSIGHRHFDPIRGNSVADVFVDEISRFEECLQLGSEKFLKDGGGNSTVLQKNLREALKPQGYGGKTPFFYFDEKTPANYQVDFFRHSAANQNLTHVAGEFAFDNRQAMGTNILKVDFSLKKLAFLSADEFAMGVLVTVLRDSRFIANWDGSVADFEDYDEFLQKGFSSYLKFPMHVFGIHADS